MSYSHLSRVRRILDKLSQVRTRGISCFGDSHRFRLMPPLSEAHIGGFEAKHGITLPEDFRAFLQYGGGSGAGPYYGLYPLEKWDDFATCVPDGASAKDFLRRPCMFAPGANDHHPLSTGEAYVPAFEGTLCLGSQGCLYFMRLIVSGPYRGRVAYVDAEGDLPPYVVRDEDFLSWYERWLDELLAGFDDSSFGYGPAGGEERLLAIIADSSSDDELAGEAARNLTKLPRLSKAVQTKLLDLLEHSVPGVRQGAVNAIEKYKVRAAIPLLTKGLCDPDLYVASALMSMAPDTSADALRSSMLEATCERRASATYYALRKAGKLTRDDLLHILRSSSLERLRASASSNLQWTPADHDLAARLLADPSRNVRLNTALGLLRVDIPVLASVLIERLQEERDATIIDHLLTMLARLADPAAANVFAKWMTSSDDFHRLNALEGLVRLDANRARKLAATMLGENRPPLRMPERQSCADTIATLTSRVLRTGTWHARRANR